MGKGDKRSRRGKVTNGSYGNSRMRKDSTPLYDQAEASAEQPKEEKKPVEKKKETAKKAAPEAKAEKTPKAEPAEKKED